MCKARFVRVLKGSMPADVEVTVHDVVPPNFGLVVVSLGD